MNKNIKVNTNHSNNTEVVELSLEELEQVTGHGGGHTIGNDVGGGALTYGFKCWKCGCRVTQDQNCICDACHAALKRQHERERGAALGRAFSPFTSVVDRVLAVMDFGTINAS
ncbi:MAG: hypothetical protein LBJ95_03000 [Oscillospiraceae bacterium]|jgi:hypothetical protein|nr:hypothetical protein [Oscillospiraceae bacterium]